MLTPDLKLLIARFVARQLAGGRRNAAPAAFLLQVLIAPRLFLVILSQDRSAKR